METDLRTGRALVPFGIEITADLSVPLSPSQRDAFRALFNAHGLILARHQRLSLAEQTRLASYIDRPIDDGDSKYISNRRPDDVFGNTAIGFHADIMNTPHPPVGLTLHAVDVDGGTSATLFADAVRAAAMISPALRQRVAGREGLMISNADSAHRGKLAAQPQIPGVTWPQRRLPILGTHPITGAPMLNVSYLATDSIVNLPEDESEALLTELFAVLYAPDNVLEHRWHNGDLIMWDNFRLQHARPPLDAAHKRTLQRVTFGGKGYGEMYPEIMALMKASAGPRGRGR